MYTHIHTYGMTFLFQVPLREKELKMKENIKEQTYKKRKIFLIKMIKKEEKKTKKNKLIQRKKGKF